MVPNRIKHTHEYDSTQAKMADTTTETPVTWRTIQKMMVSLSQELYSNFTCRPCTPGMIEDWIMRTMTEHYSEGDCCEVECHCEDKWECPHIIHEESFLEDFHKGINRITKVILDNLNDLDHNRPDTFPASVRDQLIQHANDRYEVERLGSEEEYEEAEEQDYEMDDEEMYAYAYGAKYGSGFVY